MSSLVRSICLIPREQALLRTRSVRVRSVADGASVIRDLLDTWPTVGAYGIAAPQIGVSKRLFVYKPYEAPVEMEPIALTNPKIIRASGEVKDYDGCLSVPGIYGETRRAERIEISCQDANGVARRLKFEGFTARIIQHEMDHLDGVLFIDRLDTLNDLYTLDEVPSEVEGEEPKYRKVPLTEDLRALIEGNRRLLPGHAFQL